MKKLSLFLMAILAFGLTSCDDTFVEPTPQFNPQEPILSGYGLTVEKGANISAPLDLNTLETEIEVIKTTTTTPALEDGQKVEYIAYVSNTIDFAKKVQLKVVEGFITKDDMNNAYRELFGKTPKANDMFIQCAAFLADGTSRVRYGTKDTYFGQTQVSVTPIPESFVIEDAYYLIGDVCAWSFDNAIKFNHSEADVYDDPVFTVNVEVGANSYWKIIPQSGMDNKEDQWAGQWGVAVDGSTEPSGALVNVGANAGKIEKAGRVRITINMMDNTYKIEEVGEPFIYLVGNPNGWDINSDKCKLESKNNDDIYVGTFVFSGNGENNFRFYNKLGDWDNGSIGSQLDDSPMDITDQFVDGVFNGKIVQGGKGSFGVKTDGTYKITVNLVSNTIKIEGGKEDPSEWTYVYMVGDINGWKNTADATAGQMVCKTKDNIYSATFTLPDSGDGKGMSYFRFLKTLDGTWTSQIGTSEGTDEILEFDEGVAMAAVTPGKEGAFKVPAGKYNVNLDLNENIMVVTQVAE